MAKTIKNLADELGVSKTAIRKHMDDQFREEFTIKDGNKILIKDEGAEELKNQFANQSETEHEPIEKPEEIKDSNASSSVNQFDILAKQLNSQADQLIAKDKQIADLHKLLDQSQQLQLDVQNKLRKIESAPKVEQIANDNGDTAVETLTKESTEQTNHVKPKKRHWWNF
ncbi:DUF536 domain-containing protein [Lentilactobacillus laojiaonis]|uniref:DUF536 domain-containing protein n=1 Tax=Lentilactobacillus laojiaonis TaxID=2883998 RepID=UPI001D0A8101|nr:DUF536 domain-containing protein [Lentilactobacillus laojiaonis]UDM32183.1 DUF536 domain-containing protein [Lentilactobacillus laojiaonis]